MSNGNGPYESIEGQDVVTYGCGECDALHPRDDYEETSRQVEKNGTLWRVYLCPNGHEVVMDMKVDLGKPSEPSLIELDPKKIDDV